MAETTVASGQAGAAVDATQPSAEALARVRVILEQLEELEPRLTGSTSGEVEMTLLERATDLVEEAGRLLERLGRLTG
jgi:hypothetical protein